MIHKFSDSHLASFQSLSFLRSSSLSKFLIETAIEQSSEMTLEENLLEQDSSLMSMGEAVAATPVEEMGKVVAELLSVAKDDERLICDIDAATDFLERNCEDVMVCILPSVEESENEGVEETSSHIFQTLIEAFCLENRVPVVKVDSVQKLTALVASELSHTVSDAYCVLIEKQWDALSELELRLKTLQTESEGAVGVLPI